VTWDDLRASGRPPLTVAGPSRVPRAMRPASLSVPSVLYVGSFCLMGNTDFKPNLARDAFSCEIS
jgi:hypothetical protein